MVKNKPTDVYDIIDNLVDMELVMEKHYFRLREMGFRKNEANEILEYFVVNKLNKIMED